MTLTYEEQGGRVNLIGVASSTDTYAYSIQSKVIVIASAIRCSVKYLLHAMLNMYMYLNFMLAIFAL